MYQYHPNMQSIIFPISIHLYIPTHYYIIYLESHYSKIQNNLCLTFFPWTNDGFWTLGLDGGTGRSKEAGALHWWMGLFTHWLQKDLILARKQQAPEADKALLKRKKKKKSVPLEALGSLNVFHLFAPSFSSFWSSQNHQEQPKRVKYRITCNQGSGLEWIQCQLCQCENETQQIWRCKSL